MDTTNPFNSLEYQIKHSYQISGNSLPPDGRSHHTSRFTNFHNSASHQRDSSLPYTCQSIHLTYNQSETSNPSSSNRSFSPYRPYHGTYQSNNYLQTVQGDNRNELKSPYQQRKIINENRWHSPVGSPLPVRNQATQDHHAYGNTSPIVLQRFYHQQKQQQKAQEAEEAAKEDLGIRKTCMEIVT